jgi:hypothetical protein
MRAEAEAILTWRLSTVVRNDISGSRQRFLSKISTRWPKLSLHRQADSLLNPKHTQSTEPVTVKRLDVLTIDIAGEDAEHQRDDDVLAAVDDEAADANVEELAG